MSRSYETARLGLIEQRNLLLEDGFRLEFSAYPDEVTKEVDQDDLEEAVAQLEQEIGDENVAEIDDVFGLDGRPKHIPEAVSVFARKPRAVYDDLCSVSQEDIDTANVYFLGDGVTVIIGKSVDEEEAPLRLSLLDEKSDTLVSAGVGPDNYGDRRPRP